MARKKQEFRGDRLEASALSKLCPTKKQRLAFLKWFLYGLVLLVLSVAQDVIFSRFRFLGATTDLVPCGIILICVLEGASESCVFALVASTVYLFSGTAPGAYCIALITFLAMAGAIFRQSFLRKGFSAAMLCLSAAMVCYEVLVLVAGVFLSMTRIDRISVFLLTGLYSLIIAPAVYPIALAIGKIGGETWKE